MYNFLKVTHDIVSAEGCLHCVLPGFSSSPPLTYFFAKSFPPARIGSSLPLFFGSFLKRACAGPNTMRLLKPIQFLFFSPLSFA